jgi:lysophospholipase L1-like esterase
MTKTQHIRKFRSQGPSPSRKLLFRVLAALLPILGLEAAARVYWVQFVEPRPSDSDLYQELLGEKVLNDEVPYQFFPNRTFDVASTPTSTNNLRLRGDYDINLSVNYEGTRILCIGDSVTFGYAVSGNAAAYPAVLERNLQRRGVTCQVLNGGMPRFRIEHLAILFDDRLRQYVSDVVIILGGWNNANDHVLRPIADTSWRGTLEKHWFMLKLVRRANVLPQLGERQHAAALIDAAGLEKYNSSLRRLIASARDSGAEPVLCTLPHFFHNLDSQVAKDKAATFTPVGTLEQLAQVADAMNDEIRSVGLDANVPVIELTSINEHRLFGDAIHPNDEGSAMIAQLVEAYVEQLSQLFPAATRPRRQSNR